MGRTPEWLYGVWRVIWGDFLRGGLPIPIFPPLRRSIPSPPRLGWGEHPREWTGVFTLVSGLGSLPYGLAHSQV